MPLNLAKVGLAVQSGLSSVCATCRLYWEARDRGLPEPKCLAKDGCGSPLKGDDFHEYAGPITNFERWCFACGRDSKFGVRVQGRERLVGVCEEHVKWLDELRPVDSFELPGREVRGGPVPTGRLLGRKTVAQAILEVEEFYAKKDGVGPE